MVYELADMRSLYFRMVLGILALAAQVSRADDLTTLDGTTFTNITEVAKYPKQVFFTCDQKRVSVTISNLPQKFREKYGLIVNTNALAVSDTRGDEIDRFLAANANSDLTAEREKTCDTNGFLFSWKITCHADQLEFVSSHFSSAHTGHSEDNYFKQERMSFAFGEEKEIQKMFDKYIEWEAIASDHNAIAFNKEIAILPSTTIRGAMPFGNANFVFDWDKDRGAVLYAVGVGTFNKDDVVNFKELLRLVPDLKRELVEAIQKREGQKALFK